MNNETCPGCDKQGAHTIECNFQHFLSYSGLSGEPADVRAKLFKAYEANWAPGTVAPVMQASPDPMPKRTAFIAWCKSRGLETDVDKDAWGAQIFKHTHIQAMWEGWFNAPVIQAGVPEGWRVRKDNDGVIVVQHATIGGYVATEDSSNIASTILYHFADSVLAAAPVAPVATVQDERSMFETCRDLRHCDFTRNKKDGHYYSAATRCAWMAWLVRATQSAPISAQEPLTECRHCGFFVALNRSPADQVSAQEPVALAARRYERLRIIGAAPGGHKCLDRGTVLCFQTLDAYIDADIAARPSRGEFTAPTAPQAGSLRHSEVYVADLEDSLQQIADAVGLTNEAGADALIVAVRKMAEPQAGSELPPLRDMATMMNRAANGLREPSSNNRETADKLDEYAAVLWGSANADLVAARQAPQAVAAPDRDAVWKSLVEQAIAVLQRHIVPGELSDHDALSELYGIFDGPVCNDALIRFAITQPIAAPADPHWYDTPQDSLGGKTMREGYAANPSYASQQPLPAQSISDDLGFADALGEFLQDINAKPYAMGLTRYIDAWAARLSQPRSALSTGDASGAIPFPPSLTPAIKEVLKGIAPKWNAESVYACLIAAALPDCDPDGTDAKGGAA